MVLPMLAPEVDDELVAIVSFSDGIDPLFSSNNLAHLREGRNRKRSEGRGIKQKSICGTE